MLYKSIHGFIKFNTRDKALKALGGPNGAKVSLMAEGDLLPELDFLIANYVASGII